MVRHCCQRCPSRRQLIVQWWHRRWHSPWWQRLHQQRVPVRLVLCIGSRTGTAHHDLPSCSQRGQTGSHSGPRRSDRSTAPPGKPTSQCGCRFVAQNMIHTSETSVSYGGEASLFVSRYTPWRLCGFTINYSIIIIIIIIRFVKRQNVKRLPWR